MVVRIRLARFGHVHRPFYRIRVCDSRSPRDGKCIEQLGTYDPLVDLNGCKVVRLNVARTRYWLGVGSQPSPTVRRLLSRFNLTPIPPHNTTINPFHSKDQQQTKSDEDQLVDELSRLFAAGQLHLADVPTEAATEAAAESSTPSASSTASSLPPLAEYTPFGELPWQRRVRERTAKRASQQAKSTKSGEQATEAAFIEKFLGAKKEKTAEAQ